MLSAMPQSPLLRYRTDVEKRRCSVVKEERTKVGLIMPLGISVQLWQHFWLRQEVILEPFDLFDPRAIYITCGLTFVLMNPVATHH